MKTYNIILFIIIQGLISVVFSQEVRDGYKIFTETSATSPGRQYTFFQDMNDGNYKIFPINKDGERLWDPSARFSSKEKIKRIEREVYSEEERRFLLQYTPRASATFRATDGKIVSVTFTFVNLPDSSAIDTKKLKKFQKRIMEETYFENITFRGGEAVSGYLPGFMLFFRP